MTLLFLLDIWKWMFMKLFILNVHKFIKISTLLCLLPALSVGIDRLRNQIRTLNGSWLEGTLKSREKLNSYDLIKYERIRAGWKNIELKPDSLMMPIKPGYLTLTQNDNIYQWQFKSEGLDIPTELIVHPTG